jgi:H/ACA ribonucleoprotein complex subunit 4
MRGHFVIKEEAETNPAFGKYPYRQSISKLLESSVIIVDKPAGPTSHQVASWVKEMLKVKKAGHGGTLDPNVTGVLPVALESATRAIGFLHAANKEYVGVMKLHGDAEKKKIKEITNTFIGKIWQMPPKEAAVKRVRRQRTIHYLHILEIDNRDILFKVGCEGGTYIRVLCKDIGKKLGTGAHMHELRRTKSGPFTESEAVILHDILDSFVFWKEEGDENIRNFLHPMEKLTEHFNTILIKDSAVDAICHGANITAPGVSQVQQGIKKDDLVQIKTLKGEIVAIAKALYTTPQIIEKNKGEIADTKRVLMNRGTYPPMWKRLR